MRNWLYILLIIGIFFSILFPKNSTKKAYIKKINVDDYNNFTTVGQIGLTVTNFGVLGEGWNNPNQPSCRYKQYSENIMEEVEHFSYSGLWIGGEVKGEKRVSTAIVDGVFDYGSEGFEFSVDNDFSDTIKIKSSLKTSDNYSEDAISHEDFICEYNDFSSNINNHKSMGIRIHQESYAWKEQSLNSFVILNYTIYNESHLIDDNSIGWDIKNLYLGMWVDAAIANMNYTSKYDPGGGFSWYDNQNGFDQSIDCMNSGNLERNIGYQYDANGDDGYAQSYVGIRLLGSANCPRTAWNSYYRQWVWSTSTNPDYPEYISPTNDEQRYNFMKESVPIRQGEAGYSNLGFPNDPNSWIFLLSAGPFGNHSNNDSTELTIKPGESINIALAVVCASWANSLLEDSPDRKEFLYKNADWAQKVFNGEDINGNGLLDENEDIDGDNIIDRFITPPSPPINVKAEWNYPEVLLRWNSGDDNTIGYNIYKKDTLNNNIQLNHTLIEDTIFTVSTVVDSGINCFYIVSLNEYNMESSPSKRLLDYSTKPEIQFAFGSNPSFNTFSKSDTAFTFSTRTFHWRGSDLEGDNTIENYYYALDDTSTWNELDKNTYKITIENIEQGEHHFYIKTVDNSGLYSDVIVFPDQNKNSPKCWYVKELKGNILIVDDFWMDPQKQELQYHINLLKDSLGVEEFSYWQLDNSYNSLPFDSNDVFATLDNFSTVIWYSPLGYNYLYQSQNGLKKYIKTGKSLIINSPNIVMEDISFFNSDSSIYNVNIINNGGRLMPNTQLLSQKDEFEDLYLSQLFGQRVSSFECNDSNIVIYRLEENPSNYDGQPVIGILKENPGKIAVLTIPFRYIGGKLSNILKIFINEPNGIKSLTNNKFLDQYQLNNNYPNPFNPQTTIEYYLPKEGQIELSIFNLKGEKISTLVNKNQSRGVYSIIWNAENFSSGIYFYMLKSENFEKVNKCILLK